MRTLIVPLALALFAFGTLAVDHNVPPTQNSVEIADGGGTGPGMAPPPIPDPVEIADGGGMGPGMAPPPISDSEWVA